MVRANRYLHKRSGKRRSGERFYLRVPVPADLRAVFGRLIERPLRTSDPRVARIRRDALLAEVRAMLERARQSQPSRKQSPQRAAPSWRALTSNGRSWPPTAASLKRASCLPSCLTRNMASAPTTRNPLRCLPRRGSGRRGACSYTTG
jgi:hypothetical protein